MLFLKVLGKDGAVKFESKGNVINALYESEFVEGDRIAIRLDGYNYVAVRLDETLKESIIYLPNRSFEFRVPSKRELQACYNPKAFQGEKHLLSVREVEDDEFYSTRNISLIICTFEWAHSVTSSPR